MKLLSLPILSLVLVGTLPMASAEESVACQPYETGMIGKTDLPNLKPTVQKAGKFLDCIRILTTKRDLGALRTRRAAELLDKFFASISENEAQNLVALKSLQAKCEANSNLIDKMKSSESPLLGGAAGELLSGEASRHSPRVKQVLEDFTLPTAHCDFLSGTAEVYLVGGLGLGVAGMYCRDTDGSRSFSPEISGSYGVGVDMHVGPNIGTYDRSHDNRDFLQADKRDESGGGIFFGGVRSYTDANGSPKARIPADDYNGEQLDLLDIGVVNAHRRSVGIRIPLPRSSQAYAKEVLTNFCASGEAQSLERAGANPNGALGAVSEEEAPKNEDVISARGF